MKLKSLKGRGIGRLRSEFSLPIDKLNGTDRVVAIRGFNGAGKTTMLECGPGTVYGSVPSHGLLTAMANLPDSYTDAIYELDQDYHLQRIINAARKTPAVESYIFDADGTPLNDGKQKTFKEVVSKLFPPEELYLASGFLAQVQSRQFLALDRRDRRKLFVEMIGCKQLQVVSDAAGSRAKSLASKIAEFESRAAVLHEQADRLPTAETRVASATQARRDAADAREKAEVEARELKAKLDEWAQRDAELAEGLRFAKSEVEKAEHKRDTAQKRVDELRQRLAKTSAERAKLSGRLCDEGELRAAINNGEQAKAELSSLQEQQQQIAAHREAWSKEREQWIRKGEELRAAHVKKVGEYDNAVSETKNHLDRTMNFFDQLKSQASRLDEVPCHGEGEFTSCPLLRLAVNAKNKLDETSGAVIDAEKTHEAAVDNTKPKDEAEKELNKHIKTKPAEPPRFDDNGKLAELRVIVEAGDKAAIQLAAMAEVQTQIEQLDANADELRAEIDEAQSLRVGVEAAVAGASNALRNVEEVRSDHVASCPPSPDEKQLAVLRDSESEAGAELARAEELLRAARYAVSQLDEVGILTAATVSDLDDWRHLQKAFGPEGIQALEIDAAGPEVSELINKLLHSCFGSRFSARLETTQLKADGKGTKEVFDLIVIDSEMGREGSASDLSGGEKVIVAEALSLAIAIYNARKSSVPILDLWRDEVAGALDVANAHRYVTMLRGAVDVGGFHRIYFVTHQPDLWEQVDAVIHVDNGQAEVEQ